MYTPALVCLLAREDMRDTSQGYLIVDGGPEIRTKGLEIRTRGPGNGQEVPEVGA